MGDKIIRKQASHPIFLLGLGIRLVLMLTVAPDPVSNWYAPFVETTDFGFDPWGSWIDLGGDPAAFPYGYVMWLILLPLTSLFHTFNLPSIYAHAATILIVDMGMLILLLKIFPRQKISFLYTYWISPIIIISTYYLGHNDLVCVFLLFSSIWFIKKINFFPSGFLLSMAISAKLSMILVLPFMLVYIINNKSVRRFLFDFLKGLLSGIILFFIPFVFSSSGMSMLFNNPEMDKIYQMAFSFNSNTTIYLVPLCYSLFLYMTWRIKRVNFDLFHGTLGLALFLIVLITPAARGWFIWVIPLLAVYQSHRAGKTALVLSGLFSLLYILGIFASGLPNKTSSLIHTAMISTGIILILRIWRETVKKNDYFRFTSRPFVIGVAGDSGSGKDGLVEILTGLFGKHSVALLSGDDYHHWDRRKPMWQVTTPLNPAANDLEEFANDLMALMNGRSTHIRHYDHAKGKKGSLLKIDSNDIIISSGLHSLYLPILRQCCDLRIYLDMDEELRKYLKIQRDIKKRGHTKEQVLSSLKKRQKDSERFIRTQIQYADLVLRIYSINQLSKNSKRNLKLGLTVKSRLGLNETTLARVLIGNCGLKVDMDTMENENGFETRLTIQGETSAEDMVSASKKICPKVLDFLDSKPIWKDGISGLMQLVVLSHINQVLAKRVLW